MLSFLIYGPSIPFYSSWLKKYILYAACVLETVFEQSWQLMKNVDFVRPDQRDVGGNTAEQSVIAFQS